VWCFAGSDKHPNRIGSWLSVWLNEHGARCVSALGWKTSKRVKGSVCTYSHDFLAKAEAA
jgi:hypothetical protein